MKKFNSQQGQINPTIAILVLLGLIMVALIFVPRFLKNIPSFLQRDGGQVIGFANLLNSPTPSPSQSSQTTPTPSSTTSQPTSPAQIQPSATLPPTPSQNSINGTIRVENNTERKINKVSVVYCGQASIPPSKQDCQETIYNQASLENNFVWPTYQSVNSHYFSYVLIKDSNNKPMEIGKSYMIAWAKAEADGDMFLSEEKWLSVVVPAEVDFKILVQ